MHPMVEDQDPTGHCMAAADAFSVCCLLCCKCGLEILQGPGSTKSTECPYSKTLFKKFPLDMIKACPGSNALENIDQENQLVQT